MSVRFAKLFLAGLLFTAAMASTIGAGTLLLTEGDTTYERVYFGYGGASRENLSSVLASYVDPVTRLPSPIVRPDGNPIVVGNVDLGEDPAASDQLQIQRFFAAEDHDYQFTYLGLGYAGYRNIVGLYSYAEGETDKSRFTYTPLLTQGVNAPGTVVTFSVPANHYFGFYLSADGGRTELSRFFTENRYNTDNRAGVETDHVLTFTTNRGLLLAWEDLPLGSNGKLGDQDYEDMIGGLLTYQGGAPLPEPATMALMGSGLGFMVILHRSKRWAAAQGGAAAE